ncbi:hypothetical protein K2173_012390 [Erythroxylum novogranatense]|uniref:BHLH domain-containing protein n=1 Tax=Erythroxylum novogranatense TaxID=1862640 RepID=A0AAV8UAZ3_9ROSI|nr:hypothetical protein K2173_012390 [Erythroxylum novogranatense]
MSLLYGQSFIYPEGELRKNQDFMEFNHHHYHQQEQQQHNSGLMSYHSAPSSFFDSLVNGHGGGGGGNSVGFEDLNYFRYLIPEMDGGFGRFVQQTQSNGSGGSDFHDLQELGERPVIKQEVVADSQMVHQGVTVHVNNNSSATTRSSLTGSYSAMNSPSLEHPMQVKKTNIGNGSNLVRQNSSPAGLFSNLGVDSGLAVMGDVNPFRACNGTSGEAVPSTSRLSNHANFPSRPRILHKISETGDESFGACNSDVKDGKRHSISAFSKDSWDDNSLSLIQTVKNNDVNLFSSFNTSDNQNGQSGNGVNGLTHHLSLPKTSIEKLLHFQSSIPCKIRAKRGCATHPRSIAERVRRTRISERMRKLQELFPNIDKQTNTADMLDVAVEYIKDLQKRVEMLTDNRAKCTCSRKQKLCSPLE